MTTLIIYENLSSGGIVNVIRRRVERESNQRFVLYFQNDVGGGGLFSHVKNATVVVGKVGHELNIKQLAERGDIRVVRLFSHYHLAKYFIDKGIETTIEHHRSDEQSLFDLRRNVPVQARCIVPSKWMVEFTSAVWGGNIEVVENDCDTSIFHRGVDRYAYSGVAAAKPEYVYVGQLGFHKGIDSVLRAFSLFTEEVGRRKLTVVISQALKDQDVVRLLGAIERLGIQDCVHLLWRVDRPMLADIFRSAARSRGLNIIGSLRESFGLVVIEAAACGLSTLGPNVSAIPELIQSSALLYEQGNIVDMAGRLTEWDKVQSSKPLAS